ncbi:spermidine synthase [Subtercola boreus]|uniref:Spermine synthase n=1 Tax=Subtercola boreus TaxID=120213 RepID=A0A3E0W8E5_9MICO|nr:fused MFS/spermidine synthase [Subtercola boreus]RFA19473.1 spermine synthase [Subtercola boreus]RFA19734.1 spermine synthase [Subtercola boreus]RFA26100.1 spermine synthase [Subtercola boreus]
MRAVVEADRHQPGAFTLVVDGTPQSHVALEDPTYLAFEYVRRIGHGIDLVAPEGEPITALHLGGGAFTLPRYVAATRPGSRQQVVELESGLVDFVREQLPLPKEASIRVRHGDAREVLAKLPHGLRGTVDVLVVDVFSGARTPAHVTSVEFYRLASALLGPTGILTANVADGAGLAFARSQAATLAAVFAHVALVVDPQVLKSRRFGNVVMFASDAPLPFDRLPRLVASDPTPAKVVDGAELRAFIQSAAVVTDQTAVPSPPPARSIFQVKPGSLG